MKVVFTEPARLQKFVDNLFHEHENVFVHFHTQNTHFCHYEKPKVFLAFLALDLGDVVIIEYKRNRRSIVKYYMLDMYTLRPISHALFDRCCNYSK